MAEIEQMTIGPGSQVTMNFTLSFSDGTIADSNAPGEPLSFAMGDGSLINGLEMAITGLKVGDRHRVEIDPLNGFGYSDPDNIHHLPRDEFSSDLPVDPGTVISFSTPSGEEIPGTIIEVNDNEVTVDFNHPLAGHDVIFEVEILDVQPPQGTDR